MSVLSKFGSNGCEEIKNKFRRKKKTLERFGGDTSIIEGAGKIGIHFKVLTNLLIW